MCKVSLILISILLIFSSCDNPTKDFSPDYELTEEVEEDASSESNKASISPKKVIKTGSIRFQTNDASQARKQIAASAKKYDAYISSETSNSYDNNINYSVEVRIPSAHFDAFLDSAIKGVDELDEKNINQKDVTDKFIDLESRLKSKRVLEERYLELVKKAKKISEILEIEQELNSIREEIEAKQGRLKYLQSQVSYSTIQFEFYTTNPNRDLFSNKLGDSFQNGWELLKSLVIALVNIWPFILLAIITLSILKLIDARRKSKKKIQED